MNIKYCECVCSFSYTACKAHVPYFIVVCGLSVVPYFSTLTHKRYDFRKEVAEHKVYILISFTTFVRHISYSKKKPAILL
jgi:hypothetical protein